MLESKYISPLGTIVIIADSGYLVYCNWDSEDCNQKYFMIKKFLVQATGEIDYSVIKETKRQLKEYFEGKRMEFNLPVKLNGSDFQTKVWEEISRLKYGETITYKELSNKCGRPKALRAVARACGANPIAVIIPCHRIVSSSGKIGGYTGGVVRKVKLLEMEQER